MSKRIIPLFLAFCLLCTCMSVTAFASDVPAMQQLLNVLEFDTVNGSGNYYMTAQAGKATASFQLPYGTIVRYIDMYISTNNKVISGVNWVINGVEFPLTVTPVYGNTYYRIYGQVSGGYTDEITLDFQWAESGSWHLQFYSLDVSAQTFSGHSAPSTLTLEGWEQYSVTQETGTSAVMLTAQCGSEGDGISIGVGDYLVGVHNDEWRKYDYMNFTMIVYVATVNSITCSIGNQQIPIELNFVEGTIPEYDSMWRGEGNSGENRVFYDVNVRVDLTGVNRTLTDELVLTVAGTSGNASVALYDSRGYTIADLPEAELTWLQKIWKGMTDGFQDVVDAILGDTGAADEFQQEVTDRNEALEGIGSAMDSVDTPDDFDPVIPEVDSIGHLVHENGLGYIVNSPYILPLFTASLILCFGSYALYGKKG